MSGTDLHSRPSQATPFSRVVLLITLCFGLMGSLLLLAAIALAVFPLTNEGDSSSADPSKQTAAAATAAIEVLPLELQPQTASAQSEKLHLASYNPATNDKQGRDSSQTRPHEQKQGEQQAESKPALVAVSDHDQNPAPAFGSLQSNIQQTAQQQSSSIDLQYVDNLIKSGNYTIAVQRLNESASRAVGFLRVQIRLRLGLCAELMGQPQQALSAYRSLTALDQSPSISDAATIASARLLIQIGHRDVANAMLMRLLLSREQSLQKDVHGDVVHALAMGLTSASAGKSLLDESEWLIPRPSPTPEELLSRWSLVSDRRMAKTPPESFEIRQLTRSPNGILTTIHSDSNDIVDVLDRITGELNWTLKLNNDGGQALHTRVSMIHCRELPLDVVLDMLLRPLSFRWTFENEALHVFHSTQDETPTSSTQQDSTRQDSTTENSAAQNLRLRQDNVLVAERFLQLAVSLAPEHDAAPVSYLLLGTTAAKLGDIDGAVNSFQMSIDLFPHSHTVGAAIFNLGKASLLQGKRGEALSHFYRTVDRVSGLETDAVAYLYIGRILLENNTPREAISPLMRGLSLTENTNYEPVAALLLSAAYLMSGNPSGANSVLLKHRLAFEGSEEMRSNKASRNRALADQAAFLSSLTRFFGSRGEQRNREARELMTALTTVKVETMFGGHSAYLVGVAFGVLGLTTQQTAVFQQSLSGSTRFPLQQKMRLLLTGQVSLDDSLNHDDRRRRLNADELPEPDPQLVHQMAQLQVALANAKHAFRHGKHDEVIDACRGILRDCPDSDGEAGSQNSTIRRSCLSLMGKAYQAKGDHKQAVRCFSGLTPQADAANELQNQQESQP